MVDEKKDQMTLAVIVQTVTSPNRNEGRCNSHVQKEATKEA